MTALREGALNVWEVAFALAYRDIRLSTMTLLLLDAASGAYAEG